MRSKREGNSMNIVNSDIVTIEKCRVEVRSEVVTVALAVAVAVVDYNNEEKVITFVLRVVN